MSVMTIGKLATATGVHLETIRYYERIKLMPPPARTRNGHRAYVGAHIQRLNFIRRSRELGFSIDDIRAMLALGESASEPCGEVKRIASAHLEQVRAKLAGLAKLERILAEAVACCSDGASPSCSVLAMLETGHIQPRGDG